MDVIVIGGGASGLVASIFASKKANVTILEKNKVVGKKINITGNGKCNFLNENFDIKYYNTNKIDYLITNENKNKILSFMDKIGVEYYSKNNYYYPLSNQAITVSNALLKEALVNKVNIKYETEVEDIIFDKKITVVTNNGNFKCDKLIVATGSKAAPKTGSDGKLYEILSKYHTINEVKPSLTKLITDKVYKDLSGVRSNVKVTLEGKTIEGEIQFTSYGLSGICILNLSRNAIGKNISVDLVPTIPNIIEYLSEKNNRVNDRTISELLDGLLNYKLVNQVLKLSNIKNEDKFDNLNNKQKELLKQNLKSLSFKIIDKKGFEEAQVCTGGISLDEIDKSFKSKKIDNLYIVGEILDVDGECGGFNIAFAFLSGMIGGSLND